MLNTCNGNNDKAVIDSQHLFCDTEEVRRGKCPRSLDFKYGFESCQKKRKVTLRSSSPVVVTVIYLSVYLALASIEDYDRRLRRSRDSEFFNNVIKYIYTHSTLISINGNTIIKK